MPWKVHVFVGPTLPPSDRLQPDCFQFHGPVAQGDVYHLVSDQPDAIAIIDGYFERVPAVWHKEILWALSQGVRVFGAASMGALRAAELHPFGMVGVGRIFENYREGKLTSDDEVALVHGDESEGFRPGSEAMVNVRATLAALSTAGILSQTTARILADQMKSLYYPERNYADLVGWARGKIPEDERVALRDAVLRPEGRLDQKREDALLLLQELRKMAEDPPPRLQVGWHFHHTDAWETVRRRALARAAR